MIPFAPPRIDQKIIDAVTEVLRSGWITTGPKTKLFEKQINTYCGSKTTVALNSATAGLELVLRWFGVKNGDEVILPAYTYAATANVIVHCGGKPVFVDVNPDDFNISAEKIRKAINSSTKVIMPVDFGGMPCDYDVINAMVMEQSVKELFSPVNDLQKKLGRILVLSDAAHSLGGLAQKKRTGSLTDISVFSFHTVKNLSTAEGGAVCFSLPDNFDHDEIYKEFCLLSLHGQNKDALSKLEKGNWKYDIVTAGFKCNMTDIAAAMGLVELERYETDTLVKRKKICDAYMAGFRTKPWAQLPLFTDSKRNSSCHLFPLRILNINATVRDRIIADIFAGDVSVNVHFIPVPSTTFYKNMGYSELNYPVALDNYSRVITLPVFYDLTDEMIAEVIRVVTEAVEKNIK